MLLEDHASWNAYPKRERAALGPLLTKHWNAVGEDRTTEGPVTCSRARTRTAETPCDRWCKGQTNRRRRVHNCRFASYRFQPTHGSPLRTKVLPSHALNIVGRHAPDLVRQRNRPMPTVDDLP